MGALDAALGALGGHAWGAGAIATGAIPRPGGTPPEFALPAVRNFRGRVGAAIPAAGIKLPAALNGTPPYSYTVTGLLAGLSASSDSPPAITGTPTTAAAVAEVTYTAEDSETPANSVSKAFQFPVVASTDATALDDWDNRGYGLPTLDTRFLVLLQSEVDVVGNETNEDIYLRPPRGTEGVIVSPSVLADMELPDGPLITRIRLHPSSDRVTLNHSGTDAEGNAVPFVFRDWRDANAGSVSFWLQHISRVDEYPVEAGDSAGGAFLRLEGDDDLLQPLLDAGELFILAMTMS